MVQMEVAIHEESYEDFKSGHIYVNKFLFDAGVRLPFKFDISEALNAFDVAPIQLIGEQEKYQGYEQSFGLNQGLKAQVLLR
ncbi:hypothetical protein ACLOJK_032396 [Asimina triloba]